MQLNRTSSTTTSLTNPLNSSSLQRDTFEQTAEDIPDETLVDPGDKWLNRLAKNYPNVLLFLEITGAVYAHPDHSLFISYLLKGWYYLSRCSVPFMIVNFIVDGLVFGDDPKV